MAGSWGSAYLVRAQEIIDWFRDHEGESLTHPAAAVFTASVGQIVMERLDLIADPLNQTLRPRPESPDRPLLRV